MAGLPHIHNLIARWREVLASQVAAEEVAQATYRSYLRGVQRYATWCAEREQAWFAKESVSLWRQGLLAEGFRAGSVNTWFAGVRRFFAWAVIEGEIAKDATAGIHCVACELEAARPRARLSDSELLEVLDQPGTGEIGLRDRAILSLMIHAAARTIDIERACVGDVEWNDDGSISLTCGPAGDVLVIVHQHLIDALREWLQVHPLGNKAEAPLFVALGNRARGQRLDPRTIRRLVKGHLHQAGIRDSNKTTHSLRRTAIVNALERGVPIYEVLALSRHRSLQSLSGYAPEEASDDELSSSPPTTANRNRLRREEDSPGG